MDNTNQYMSQAINIAFKGIGSTSPNPSVGSVIVKDGVVISTGTTCSYGCDHSEVSSIKEALRKGADLRGAEMYVTLEPCCHHGKTPPCTDLIIKHGIRKVYIPILDPNPLVSGQGVEKLRAAGVDVEIMAGFHDKAFDILRPFRKRILTGKPFVISKSAMTLDGKTATCSGDSKWITNDYSRYIVHKLRSRVDAIIVGANTFLNDKPRLNIRASDFDAEVRDLFTDKNFDSWGRDNGYLNELLAQDINHENMPLRVVFGLREEFLNEEFEYFFCDDNYLIVASQSRVDEITNISKFYKSRIDQLNIDICPGNSHAGDVNFLLDILSKRGCMSVMLEGGSKLNGSFFDADAIDQYLYFIAPKIIGSGKSIVDGYNREFMNNSRTILDTSFISMKGDILYCGYRESIDEVK